MHSISKFALLLTLIISCLCDTRTQKAFKNNQIVPDVIKEPPETELTVWYRKWNAHANLGNEILRSQLEEAPEVIYNAELNTYYTLIFTDPDLPSRTNHSLREFHLWLVGNIPGNEVTYGQVLSEYFAPSPAKGTGYHRYTYLLFKQTDKLMFDEPVINGTNASRAHFSSQKFAEKYKLGEPVAGNFFMAKGDD